MYYFHFSTQRKRNNWERTNSHCTIAFISCLPLLNPQCVRFKNVKYLTLVPPSRSIYYQLFSQVQKRIPWQKIKDAINVLTQKPQKQQLTIPTYHLFTCCVEWVEHTLTVSRVINYRITQNNQSNQSYPYIYDKSRYLYTSWLFLNSTKQRWKNLINFRLFFLVASTPGVLINEHYIAPYSSKNISELNSSFLNAPVDCSLMFLQYFESLITLYLLKEQYLHQRTQLLL